MLHFLLIAAIAADPTITGKVVSITDGDTIKVRTDTETIKIRLDAIDAPERGQPFSQAAKKFLSKLVHGKQCRIRVRGKDKYGRTLGIVLLGASNPLFGPPKDPIINTEMVRSGLAWHYKKYSKSKTLAKLERQARDKKLGLWKDAKPVAPWDWRKMSKDERTAAITGRDEDFTTEPASESDELTAALTHWLNPKSHIRHNASCRWYGKTKNGRKCAADEGKPCSKCGG